MSYRFYNKKHIREQISQTRKRPKRLEMSENDLAKVSQNFNKFKFAFLCEIMVNVTGVKISVFRRALPQFLGIVFLQTLC